MTFRRLRARLDRLEPVASTMPGQDRKRDRIRREELMCRKRVQQHLTGQEEAELQALDTLFYDEDQDLNRRGELLYKEFRAEVVGGEPLTDDEAQELAGLDRRYAPEPK